jgi:hypothetical protein
MRIGSARSQGVPTQPDPITSLTHFAKMKLFVTVAFRLSRITLTGPADCRTPR